MHGSGEIRWIRCGCIGAFTHAAGIESTRRVGGEATRGTAFYIIGQSRGIK